MGCWGLGLDENDDTLDYVESVGDRETGETVHTMSICKLVKLWEVSGTFKNCPAVSLYALKRGGCVRTETLEVLIKTLESEIYDPDVQEEDPAYVATRVAEIAFVRSAINNGGAAPGGPVGLVGVHDKFGLMLHPATAQGMRMYTVLMYKADEHRWVYDVRSAPRDSQEEEQEEEQASTC